MNEAAASQSPRSALLRRKLQHLRASPHGARALRFRNPQTAIPSPAFNQLAALPDWILADRETQQRIGLAAALLHHRPVIDRELSGERLAALAVLIGEDHFDALCALDFEEADSANAAVLPDSGELRAIGETLKNAALSTDQSEEAALARRLCTRVLPALMEAPA